MTQENRKLAVVSREDDGDKPVEMKNTKKVKLIRELNRVKAILAKTVGKENSLFMLIEMAINSGNYSNLKVAQEAYLKLPDKFRQALENGWRPLLDGGPDTCQVLKILANEESEGKFWFHYERAMVDDTDEEGLSLANVRVYITEGTGKELVLNILKRAVIEISGNWAKMMKSGFRY